MKRHISLLLGLSAFALMPVLAQTPENMGKIHGHITNPTGASQGGGAVSLVAPGHGTEAPKYVFNVDANGDYKGEAPAGTYSAVYRIPGMANDKEADHADNVKITVGQDILQDIDMSREAYIKSLPADQQKQLEELKKHNSEALKANEAIKHINDDLRAVQDDIKAADSARATATQALGGSASKADVDAKEAEIRKEKYSDAEALMLKDSSAKPDASVLWAQLGQAQAGLKKYPEAEASFKKAIDLEATSKKPNPSIQGMANAGLGEIYARTGKVAEANAAYTEAAKTNPTQAGFYLKNETIIFFQTGNTDAQIAAADQAIAADPTSALLYYLKGNGLVGKSTMDETAHKLVAPPGCLEAYNKYLELAPNGPYATEVKGIIANFNQVIDTSYKAPSTKGKKK